MGIGMKGMFTVESGKARGYKVLDKWDLLVIIKGMYI